MGRRAQLSLELYRDPEVSDAYLTLYARQEDYEPGLMDELEEVSKQLDEHLEGTSGFLLLTTDFQPPR